MTDQDDNDSGRQIKKQRSTTLSSSSSATSVTSSRGNDRQHVKTNGMFSSVNMSQIQNQNQNQNHPAIVSTFAVPSLPPQSSCSSSLVTSMGTSAPSSSTTLNTPTITNMPLNSNNENQNHLEFNDGVIGIEGATTNRNVTNNCFFKDPPKNSDSTTASMIVNQHGENINNCKYGKENRKQFDEVDDSDDDDDDDDNCEYHEFSSSGR